MTDIDWDLTFRYFGSECTAEERLRFERWLAIDPRHRAVIDAAVAAAGRTLDSGPEPTPAASVAVRRQASASRVRGWTLAAAAALMIVAGGVLVRRTLLPPGSGARMSVELQMASTGRGERANLRLSDGTRVVLGPGSTLRYPARMTDGARNVYLAGEGYFQVTHDARRPFRVHAGAATAEDLGTAFSVRAYEEDSAVRVVVADGSVALGPTATGAGRGTVLTRGQLGRLAKGEEVASVKNVSVDAYLGWTTGRLDFDEAPLSEVVAQLGRWYDVRFRIADPTLESRRLTGSFTTESLTQVLETLAPVLDVRFERAEDSVVVHPRKSTP